MRIGERTACDSNGLTTERRIGAIVLALRAGNRHHARDRQQQVVPEFARAPGGEVYVRELPLQHAMGKRTWPSESLALPASSCVHGAVGWVMPI